METDMTIVSRKIFPQNGRKLDSVEIEIQYIFILCMVFKKTIIHACWIWTYDSRLNVTHLVRYQKGRIQRAFVEWLLIIVRVVVMVIVMVKIETETAVAKISTNSNVKGNGNGNYKI